jgi:hypothetical protein
VSKYFASVVPYYFEKYYVTYSFMPCHFGKIFLWHATWQNVFMACHFGKMFLCHATLAKYFCGMPLWQNIFVACHFGKIFYAMPH